MCNQQGYNEDQRELRYFHFSSTEFCEDFWELVEKEITNTLNILQELLINKSNADQKDFIRAEIKELRELFIERAKPCMKKFQKTAREIFALPSNVLVPGYGEDNEVVRDEELEGLKKEIEDLEEQCLEEIYYRAQLKSEVEKFKHIKLMYERVNEILNVIRKVRPGKHEKSCKELFDALKTCEEFYLKQEVSNEDQTKRALVDTFNMFKKK